MLKTLARSSALLWLVGTLVGAWYWFTRNTARWRHEGIEHLRTPVEAGQPVILLFWHRQAPTGRAAWAMDPRKYPIAVLSSVSRDGNIMVRAMQMNGVETIRGSSAKGSKDKGGAQAFREMVKRLRGGRSQAITPDGPRGPRQRMGSGPILLAQMSGAPIIPASVSMSPVFVARSWDRQNWPLPFARGLIRWGQAIHVPADADAATLERLRQHTEDCLNALHEATERAMGYEPVQPAPIPPALRARVADEAVMVANSPDPAGQGKESSD